MIPIVQLFVIQFANPQNVILLALNPKTLFVTLNVKNLNAKLNVLIKDVKCLTVLNVLPSANNLIASHIAKPLNPNVNQSAKNLNVTGNAINQLALNLNVNLFVKILIVSLKSNAAHVH
jgi:hypothetical protein